MGLPPVRGGYWVGLCLTEDNTPEITHRYDDADYLEADPALEEHRHTGHVTCRAAWDGGGGGYLLYDREYIQRNMHELLSMG